MTIPTVPRAFYAKGNLDVEAVNDNLRALSRIIARGQAQRYSTTSFRVELDGMADTDGVNGARKFSIPQMKRAGIAASVQVIGIEVAMYAPSGVAWTLTSTTSTAWGGLVVTPTDPSTEVLAQTSEPLPVTASGVDLLWTASGTSTVTRGYMVVHLLCDRGQQDGASFVGYSPTLLSAASSTAGSVLDTELTNVATAVAADTNAQTDLRLMCFSVRGLASGGSASIVIPSGIRTGATLTAGASFNNAVETFACAPVGATVTGTISSTPLGTVNAAVAGAGVSTLTPASGATLSAADGGDPTVSANDITLTISRSADGGAVAPFCYLLVWFK